jgi:hypothetical protein
MKNAYKILVEKREGKRSLETFMHRYDCSIEKEFCEGGDWIQLVQDKVQWRAHLSMVLSFPDS